jgi:hypothetical protein
MTMVKIMMKPMIRSKRSPSEDLAFPSLFLVLDAKGGEEVLYLAIHISSLFSSRIVI